MRLWPDDAVRDSEGADLLEVFLVAAVAALLAIRGFLGGVGFRTFIDEFGMRGRRGTCATRWNDTTGRSGVPSDVSRSPHTSLRIQRSLRNRTESLVGRQGEQAQLASKPWTSG